MPKINSRKALANYEPKRRNPITLGDDSNIDNNLKPIKIDGKNSLLELSDTQLDIKGNLSVKGVSVPVPAELNDLSDVSFSGGDLTISSLDTIVTSGHLTLAPDGDLNLVPVTYTLINKDTSGNAAENAKALHIDFDRTVAVIGTNAHNDIGIDLDVNSASLGTSSVVGMDIDVVGATSGTHTAIGIHCSVISADTNIGMVINTGGTHLKLTAANDPSNDYATFTLADTGDLTIATVGDGTTDSDLTLDADGDIILDSASGVFIAQKAGTEFSAANSAYAGMILGYTCLLNDDSDTNYGVTASYAVAHSTTQVTFVAPPSENVEIFVSVYAKSAAARQVEFGLSDNSTYNTIDVTHEHEVWISSAADESQLNHQWVITGLTAGTSYTYYLGAKAAQAGRITLYWGGDATGEYAPFIMKATALPATLYTG